MWKNWSLRTWETQETLAPLLRDLRGALAPLGAGPRCGLTWLCAALPTPHTVVTTDSDPAG